jgi:hypothetical protein
MATAMGPVRMLGQDYALTIRNGDMATCERAQPAGTVLLSRTWLWWIEGAAESKRDSQVRD